MDQKPIQETASRRKVLKAAGAGFIPVTRFGSTENLDTSPGKSLNGKRVFTGQGVSITLPEKAERARSRKRADVAIIRDDTTLSRGERRNLIRDGTPTFITGGTAEESLVSVLYDIDKESVSKEGVGTNETGLELSHGIEFELNRPSYQSALVPDESRGVLNTYFFGNTTLSSSQGREGSKYVSDVDVLRNIDEVIGKEEQKGNVVAGEPRSSFVSSLPTESPDEDSTCPDG